MIKSFEEITPELTDFEKDVLLPVMVNGLSKKIGVKNVINNKQMKQGLLNSGYKVSDVRIRKLIHYIRVNQLVKNLIANSKGYFIATNKEEVENFVESLQQRINSIETVKHSFIKYLNNEN